MDKKILSTLNKGVQNIKSTTELNEVMTQINQMLNERKDYLDMLEQARGLSDRGFGYIKESFEAISPLLYATDDGKRIMKEYINEIKSNKVLKDMYSIYENIYHAKDGSDAHYIVETAFNNTINKKELTESVAKLGMILAKGYITLGGHKDAYITENVKLNESIDYLATTKKGLSNVSEVSAKRNFIQNYIVENAGKNVRSTNANDDTITSIVENYNQKYGSSEYADIIKQVMMSDSKESMFEEYKKNCIDAIDEAISKDSTNVAIGRLNDIRTSLNGKVYNKATLGTDIANFIQLKETIEK